MPEVKRSLYFGPFSAFIDDYEENGYFQLHQDATNPRCKEIDCFKNFKTLDNAEKYYKKQLKKVLLNALKELNKK